MRKSISDIKFNVLVDAISAVTILEVDSKINLEGTFCIYLKTDDLSTVDESALKELSEKNSDDNFSVEFLIPKEKVNKEKRSKNDDTVCIFISEA